MKAFTRIERLERLLNKPVHGIRYTMPNGAWITLPFTHPGFSDAVQGIDSYPARIVTNAIATTQGPILHLLHAVTNPITTEPVEPVTAEV